jgi:sugar O-acyltransferase (sialic acid O-acetyltransferase NeuD family)
MRMKKIVIICKGGFGKEVLAYVHDAFPHGSDYRFDRIHDLFPEEEFHPQPDEVFIVANGEPAVREKLTRRIEKAGGTLLTLIHPTCWVAKTATIGNGAILCPYSSVGPDAVLAAHVILNVYAGCGHDARIGSFATFCPYSVAGGAAKIGERVFLGSHAFVAPKLTVGNDSKISAGAIVLRNVPAKSLAMGNPAQSRVLFPRPTTLPD